MFLIGRVPVRVYCKMRPVSPYDFCLSSGDPKKSIQPIHSDLNTKREMKRKETYGKVLEGEER